MILFLVLFKRFALNSFTFTSRKGSLDTLAKLGITVQQAKEEILCLTPEDYYRGPIPDTNKGGEFWEFGRTIYEQDIFIKLKVVVEHNAAICFAFHPPEIKMEYPLRDRLEEK